MFPNLLSRLCSAVLGALHSLADLVGSLSGCLGSRVIRLGRRSAGTGQPTAKDTSDASIWAARCHLARTRLQRHSYLKAVEASHTVKGNMARNVCLSRRNTGDLGCWPIWHIACGIMRHYKRHAIAFIMTDATSCDSTTEHQMPECVKY